MYRIHYFHYRAVYAVNMDSPSQHHVVYESRDRLEGFAIMRSQSSSTYTDCCITIVYSFCITLPGVYYILHSQAGPKPR